MQVRYVDDDVVEALDLEEEEWCLDGRGTGPILPQDLGHTSTGSGALPVSLPPPDGWRWVLEGETIEVEVAVNEDEPVAWVTAEVLTVLVDGSFQARIVLPDGSDEWDDWFSWQEEGSDWRRRAKRARKSATDFAADVADPDPVVDPAMKMHLVPIGTRVQVFRLKHKSWFVGEVVEVRRLVDKIEHRVHIDGGERLWFDFASIPCMVLGELNRTSGAETAQGAANGAAAEGDEARAARVLAFLEARLPILLAEPTRLETMLRASVAAGHLQTHERLEQANREAASRAEAARTQAEAALKAAEGARKAEQRRAVRPYDGSCAACRGRHVRHTCVGAAAEVR